MDVISIAVGAGHMFLAPPTRVLGHVLLGV